MSQAVSGIGTKLQKGDGASPEVFTTVAEVKSLKWSNRSLDFADVTNMDSTGNVKEFLPTLFNPGEIDFDINYLVSVAGATSQTGLETDYAARTRRNWRIQFPTTGVQTNGAQWNGEAYIQELSPSFEIDKQQMASVKLKCTGQWSFTAGS